MSNRHTSIIVTAALILAACGGAATDSTTTTGAGDPVTTGAQDSVTTEAAETPDALLLSYTLEPGTTYSYEVGLEQHIEMSATGDATAMGEEGLPGEAVVDVSGTATFTHTVSAGPEDGTFEINVTGDFDDFTVSGTVDGEQVDEVPDFAGIDPVDVTVIVDEQGNLVHEGETLEDPFGGAFGDLGSLGSGAAPGLDLGQFVGPLLSDEEVAVGDSWAENIETDLFGDDPVVTSVTSTVTATDQVDGFEVLVIETNSTTSPIEIDFGEFFLGLFGAFMPDDASEEEAAEFEAIMAELKFLIAIEDMESDSTTWFDAEAGLARKSEVDAGATIAMDMNIPDDQTGEMVGFTMGMSMDQQVSYRLIDGPAA